MPFIYAFNERSQGARGLSQALGWRRIRHHNSRFHGRENPVVLNWGCETLPSPVYECQIINRPEAITSVTNKQTFFRNMREQEIGGVVPSTEDQNKATSWWSQGHPVVCRHTLKGHSGEGIYIHEPSSEEAPPEAPLYTRYIKKTREYRVHVFRSVEDQVIDEHDQQHYVIDIQQKRRSRDVSDDDVDWRVRNRAGGFIYARQDLITPPQVTEVALRCMANTSLDFGAVDVIWNTRQERAYVLEINSAPGLEGQTLTSYTGALRNFVT